MRRLITLLLGLVLCGCGDSGVLLFRVSFGTVSGAPDCRDGRFNLRDQQGLTVVVVFSSSTNIVLANGSAGSCPDIQAGSSVSVSGNEGSGIITASEIRLLGG